jgi:NitT/TauT family transport system ATP-binding protein
VPLAGDFSSEDFVNEHQGGSLSKIELRGVTKIYNTAQGTVEALAGTDLTVQEGEFLCIIGPSGCGKSTLLRILAGLYKESSGQVIVRRAYQDDRPANSVVFQEYALFPWRTVLDNVAFGLEMRRVPRKERLTIARTYLEKMGLSGRADSYTYQLSGGMKQRVGLARALANDPEILLMDEPFGALDAQTRVIMQQELLRIWDDERKTVVYVTHSIEEAIMLGDRVVLMTAQPGRVKGIYPVNLPRPRELKVRTTTEFNQLAQLLWEELVDEVNKALKAEKGEISVEKPKFIVEKPW